MEVLDTHVTWAMHPRMFEHQALRIKTRALSSSQIALQRVTVLHLEFDFKVKRCETHRNRNRKLIAGSNFLYWALGQERHVSAKTATVALNGKAAVFLLFQKSVPFSGNLLHDWGGGRCHRHPGRRNMRLPWGAWHIWSCSAAKSRLQLGRV